ncbi:hypothetical protein WJX79_001465 [Trebouxia sp. C0005]
MQAGRYSVTYTAEDAAHNVASATRTVIVKTPCSTPEHFCSATCRCSTLTVCLSATSICSSTTTAAAADTTAPIITVLLNSMSVNATTAAGQLLVVTTVYVGTTYIDPGATATDNVDGNITSRLTTYGVGAVKTAAPTASASPYVITYSVTDSSGNQATPGLRYVVVTCKSPTVMGCSAYDSLDGVLTPYVQACSTSNAKYLFTATGINACSYNTSVAGVYTIDFTVTNSQGLSASVNRTLVVEPVCPSGQTLCSNKVACSASGLCPGTAARALTAVTAPVITLVTSTYLSSVVQVKQGHTYTACSSGQMPTSALPCELGATAVSASDGNLTSVVLACPPAACLGIACPGYGVAAPVPLVPCTALDNITDCGAVATDSTGADISSSIVVVDVTPCAAGAQCPACAITFAAAGLCQPGPYLYLYRAKDSYASLASAWRLVQVQQQYAVSLSLPLTLQAADLAAAQAQASTLTTGSNATNLIASAVAVGLISEFASAPNFTAAAAAQNLTWAPVSLSSVTVDSYTLAMATSDSALLTLSLTAKLGVSGDITDVADVTGSRKRRLLQTSARLLANLTCIQAELYQMEAALSTGEDPLWVVPYTTVANDYDSLLQDYTAYVEFTQKQLGNIYTFLVEQIAAIISSEESAAAVLALNYTTTSITIAGNTTPVYSNSDVSEAAYVQRLLPRVVGWTGNQVVAGVLLQTLRSSVNHTCKQRFDGFITVCTEQSIVYDEATGEAVVVPTSSGGLQPYGVDAVFLADSSAYDDTLAVADFYNTSTSSDEITPYVGTPFGFHPRAMSGFPLGFPVVFDNRLSRNASQRLWTILSDGNFLDEETASVTVRLLTYNPELQVYGYARVDFSWDSAGLIDVVTRFVAIPDVTLSLSSNKIDQTVLAAFVLHVLLTAAQLSVLMYSLVCKIRQTSATRNTIQEAFSKTWVLYDMAMSAAMLVCLITYSVYIHSLVDFQPEGTYEVYDSLGAAQARLLLPKKQDPSGHNVSAPSTYAQVPGGAGRWTLPDVNTGLDSMAEMYAQADKMADEMTLYTTLQGITLQLLILRLIKVMSAQKRLSILTTTAIKVIPWIVDVGYTVMCVALMLAVMGHVLFGDFEVTMTTLLDSISGYFEVMFTQQVASYNQDLGVTITAPMQMNWLLRSEAYAWFLRVIIVSSLREEAEGQKRIVGIHHDMAKLFAELSQNLRGAPSSALLAKLFEQAAPRSMKVNIWARLRGQQAQLTIQERQRQGIHGIHMRSLDEHLDQQELQKLLGEVIHHTRDSMDAPAPDHKTLAKVILSRFGGVLHDWPESYFQAQQTKGVGLAGIFKQAIGQHQAQKATKTRSVLARMFPGTALAKLDAQAAYDDSAGNAKSGRASLMRRAVQQAKVEAAAQAALGTWQASHDGRPEANEAPEQALTSHGRSALPRDASLGQRLGSILKGALSLSRQPSYTSLSGDEDFDSSDPYGNSRRRALPRELSLRERYGSMSLSRDPSYSSPLGHSFGGPAGLDTEPPVPTSPGKRRALPRDASYLPDWVTRTHGQTPRGYGNGKASPRSRLGTSFSSVSTLSDHEDDNFMPRWVDWPQSSLAPEVSPHQAEEEAHDDLTPAAPILQAPPHLRRQQKEVQKAEAALPRAKRPLSLASNPLSLALVHTPSMNPQLDLTPSSPVATPKGQRLFDFWHQKAEQPVTAAGPASASDIHSKAVTHASQQDPQAVAVMSHEEGVSHKGDTAGVTASQMSQAELASSPAQHLLNGPPVQLPAADSGDALLPVQSAASQLNSAQKPELDSFTLRRRQSFNFADSRKTGTSADGKPKPASKGQIAPPAKSFGGQSGQRTPIGGEATRAQRQDSSLAQLVEKYKTDSAARKQGHNEITLERINSLAAGLQHAASGKLGDTRPTAPSSVQKQVADATAAFASSSRMLPATQDKLAAGAKPEAAKTADVARPLQVNKSKSMKATAKGKAPMKHIAGASGAMVQKNNKSAHSSTSSDSD